MNLLNFRLVLVFLPILGGLALADLKIVSLSFPSELFVLLYLIIRSRFNREIFYWAMIIAALCFIGVIINLYRTSVNLEWGYLVSYFGLLKALVLFIGIYSMVRKYDVDGIVSPLTIGYTLTTLYCLVEIIFMSHLRLDSVIEFDRILHGSDLNDSRHRIRGPTFEPSYLAAYFLCCFPFLYIVSKYKRCLFLSMIVIAYYCASPFFLVIIFSTIFYSMRRLISFSLSIFILIIVTGYLLSQTLQTEDLYRHSSFIARSAGWWAGLSLFSHYPIGVTGHLNDMAMIPYLPEYINLSSDYYAIIESVQNNKGTLTFSIFIYYLTSYGVLFYLPVVLFLYIKKSLSHVFINNNNLYVAINMAFSLFAVEYYSFLPVMFALCVLLTRKLNAYSFTDQ